MVAKAVSSNTWATESSLIAGYTDANRWWLRTLFDHYLGRDSAEYVISVQAIDIFKSQRATNNYIGNEGVGRMP